MAVQRITHKKITKFNEKDGNFQPTPQPKKEVDGNVMEDDVYGERKHTYTPEPNGNLQMEQMMGKLMNKIDNIGSDSQTGTKAVEVDIQREIAISMVDQNAVKSEVTYGRVKNNKNKLKKFRRMRK